MAVECGTADSRGNSGLGRAEEAPFPPLRRRMGTVEPACLGAPPFIQAFPLRPSLPRLRSRLPQAPQAPARYHC